MRRILAASLFLFSSSFGAETPRPTPNDDRVTFKEGLNQGADISRKFLSESFRRLSSEMDSFFSSRRSSYLTNKSQLRISHITTLRQNEGVKDDVLVDGTIVLPETEKKMRLIVERKPRQLDSSESPGTAVPAASLGGTTRKTESIAALRFFGSFSEETSVTTDAGIRFDPPAQPFTRVRLHRSYFLSQKWELRFAEEIYYYFLDQWRPITVFDSDHTLSPRLLFRFGNELTWSQLTNTFDYVYGPSLFQMLSPTKGLGYHLKASATDKPSWGNTNITASIVYRQLIYRDWVFLELIPAVDFPRALDWKATPSFSVRLEAVF